MFCEYCGTPIPEGASFCPACGQKQEIPPQQGAQPQQPLQPQQLAQPAPDVYAQPQQVAPTPYADPVQPQPAPYDPSAPQYGQPAYVETNPDAQSPTTPPSLPQGRGGEAVGSLVALIILAFLLLLGILYSAYSLHRLNNTTIPERDTVVVVNHITTLSVDRSNVDFASEGGTETVSVETNGTYEIMNDEPSWLHISQETGRIVLRADENTSEENREMTLEIAAGKRSHRITVTQKRPYAPEVTITNVWHEGNTYLNGRKGMKIHADFTAKDMKGEALRMRIEFFYSDNVTHLHDRYGNNLVTRGDFSTMSSNDEGRTAWIFVPYTWLNMATGTANLSYDVIIESYNEDCTRKNNSTFTLTTY